MGLVETPFDEMSGRGSKELSDLSGGVEFEGALEFKVAGVEDYLGVSQLAQGNGGQGYSLVDNVVDGHHFLVDH